MAALRALDDLNLMMIEQPLADDDIVDHAAPGAAARRRSASTRASTRSTTRARRSTSGAAGIINIKVSRVGGLREAKRVHDLCLARGVPVWCGGMHEFGVGRAANVAICSLPGFTLPGDVSGSDKYYREDIVDPPIRAEAGAIQVPWDRPGLGFDANFDAHQSQHRARARPRSERSRAGCTHERRRARADASRRARAAPRRRWSTCWVGWSASSRPATIAAGSTASPTSWSGCSAISGPIERSIPAIRSAAATCD